MSPKQLKTRKNWLKKCKSPLFLKIIMSPVSPVFHTEVTVKRIPDRSTWSLSNELTENRLRQASGPVQYSPSTRPIRAYLKTLPLDQPKMHLSTVQTHNSQWQHHQKFITRRQLLVQTGFVVPVWKLLAEMSIPKAQFGFKFIQQTNNTSMNNLGRGKGGS